MENFSWVNRREKNEMTFCPTFSSLKNSVLIWEIKQVNIYVKAVNKLPNTDI